MRCELCAPQDIPLCTFVVTLSRYQNQWLFSRHGQRDTWETQGGHVEPHELPEQAALRELYEESGAIPRWIRPISGYWAQRDPSIPRRYGMVYLALIDRLDPLPHSEIAEVRLFDTLPTQLTYPEITPILFARGLAVWTELEVP